MFWALFALPLFVCSSPLDSLKVRRIEGGSLKTFVPKKGTCSHDILLTSQGRPLDSEVELWQGPENTPIKIRTYSENGLLLPQRIVVASSPHTSATLALRNKGTAEFPFEASVEPDVKLKFSKSNFNDKLVLVQGGSLKTFPFHPCVECVQIFICTDGRPLNARVENLQGPNTVKQVSEAYSDDGHERPIFTLFHTPGPGNVIRIINTGPLSFPLYVAALEY